MYPDIAIIDSGINSDHVHVQEVIGGHSLIMDSYGNVERRFDFSDEIGHGTAIAGIIRKHAPFARLYGIKIFQKELHASGQLLMESLKWAIKNNFKIIHLSLGIESEKYKKKLQALCRDAHDRGIVIVSAARSSEDQLLPASFETVIGVYWNRDCSEEKLIYHPGKVINLAPMAGRGPSRACLKSIISVGTVLQLPTYCKSGTDFSSQSRYRYDSCDKRASKTIGHRDILCTLIT